MVRTLSLLLLLYILACIYIDEMRFIDSTITQVGKNPVVTIGAFDGVHRGHQEILKRLKLKATEYDGCSVVISFWPHPRHVIQKDHLIKLLNTPEEKRDLLESFGIDYFIELPFTADFAKIDSRTFIQDYLVGRYKMKYFLLGYNHHFGKDRLGNIITIQKYAKEFGFGVDQVEPFNLEGENISSTKIRHALVDGKIDLANRYLGYSYSISGSIVKGKMLGRTIGFPTANIYISEDYKVIPKDGVYAVKVVIEDVLYSGMLNIGYRPTVNTDKKSKTIEVHILDFDKDIYDKRITVKFLHRLRDEMQFTGLDNLKKQLSEDKQRVKEILGKC